jgi:hypothetical protein
MRQAEAVRGRFLGRSRNAGGDHGQLAVGRSTPRSHASRLAAASHSSRPSIGMVMVVFSRRHRSGAPSLLRAPSALLGIAGLVG